MFKKKTIQCSLLLSIFLFNRWQLQETSESWQLFQRNHKNILGTASHRTHPFLELATSPKRAFWSKVCFLKKFSKIWKNSDFRRRLFFSVVKTAFYVKVFCKIIFLRTSYFFIIIELEAHFFGLYSKTFRQVFQNCILRVQKNILKKNRLFEILRIFSDFGWKTFGSAAKLHTCWVLCCTCPEERWRKIVFAIFSWALSRNFWTIGAKTSAGLPKLPSACGDDHFRVFKLFSQLWKKFS